MEPLNIYVLPSQPNEPPRALLIEGEMPDMPESPEGGVMLEGVLATWSADTGAWMVDASPVPTELGEAITEHAKSLGVEW